MFQHEDGYGGNKASSINFKDVGNIGESIHLHNENDEQIVDHDRVHDMVTNAFLETSSKIANKTRNVEERNLDGKKVL